MGGRGARSTRAAAGGPLEEAGLVGDNLTPFEQSHPERVAEMAGQFNELGIRRTRDANGALVNRATPAPPGAPRFTPDNNAPSGTLMYRDGDKGQPVMIDRARMGNKSARVMPLASVPPPELAGKRRSGLQYQPGATQYVIERTRLQRAPNYPNLLNGKK